MSVYKAANNTAALRFDIDMQNVIDTQMTGMAASLADVRVIKERVRMSDVELAAFNESVPVYLRQYGSYFAVLTLESSGDGTAIATMLRLRKSSAEPVPPPPPPLPYDAEIEYLESSGTQYIDTNIHFTSNHKIDIDFIGLTNGNVAVFGANNGNTATSGELALFWYVRGGTHVFQYVFPTTSNNVSTYVTANTSYNVGTRYHVVFDKTQFVVNDASESCIWYENYICSRTMLIGATNRNSAAVISSMKIFCVKIYESGELVFDGIPVRVGQIGYMYDRVSGELFGNAGTGDFILGADKN